MTINTSNISSFTLVHGDIIFDDPHAKSVNQKNFANFPIVSAPHKYPFYYGTGTEIDVKKRPLEIGLLSSKKLSIGSLIYLLGTFLCFHFFDFGPIQGVAFFFDIFLNFFRISDCKPIFPINDGSTHQERSVFVSL